MLNLFSTLPPFVFISFPRFSNGSLCFVVSLFISFCASMSPFLCQCLSLSLFLHFSLFSSNVYFMSASISLLFPWSPCVCLCFHLSESQSRRRPSAAGPSHEAHSRTGCEGRRSNFAIYVAAFRPAKEGRNMAPHFGQHGRYCAVCGRFRAKLGQALLVAC